MSFFIDLCLIDYIACYVAYLTDNLNLILPANPLCTHASTITKTRIVQTNNQMIISYTFGVGNTHIKIIIIQSVLFFFI